MLAEDRAGSALRLGLARRAPPGRSSCLRQTGLRTEVAHRCHDQGVTESADHEIRPSVAAGPSAKGVVLMVIATLFAIMLAFVGLRDVYRSVVLDSRGVVTTAQVTFVRYGSKADEVDVLLAPPLNRNVELVAWTGRPPVGQVIRVRYDPANPGLAAQEGSGLWGGIALALAAAAACSVAAWWYAAGERGRRHGLRWLRRPRWLAWLES